MKGFVLVALILVGLSACAGGPLALGSPTCAEGICVTLRAVEPVQLNQPVVVKITVTSERDRSDLSLTLYTEDVGVSVEGPQGWEANALDGRLMDRGAYWTFAAKANTPITFTRVLRFPDRAAHVSLHAAVSAPPTSMRPVDSIGIDLTRAGGKIYLEGTRLPEAGPQPTVPFSPRLNALGTPILTPTVIRSGMPTSRPPRVGTPIPTPGSLSYP